MTFTKRIKIRWATTVIFVMVSAVLYSGAVQLFATQEIRLFDLGGDEVNAFENTGTLATVFLFAKTDCPISNRTAPEVNRLYDEFSTEGVAFRLVYVDPNETVDSIRMHKTDYGYRFPALRDPEHQLVEYSGARVTPEAAVFLPDRSLAYLGRIDNRYVDFGVARTEATERDLHKVLTTIVAGDTILTKRQPSVGCPIQDLR